MNVFKHAFLLSQVLIAADVLADQCKTAESVTSFGAWFSQGARLTASQPFQPIKAPAGQWTVDSMKLRLEVVSGTDRQWYLLVYAPDYRVLASFGPNDFTDKGQLTVSRWTGRLFHDRVQVELVTARPDSDIVINIPAGIALPKESGDQRVFSVQTPGVVGWNDLFPKNGAMGDILPRKAGAKVGMLMTAQQSPGGNRSAWCCSAIMISPSLALTNWHCGGDNSWMQPADYWEGNVCVNATLDLAWDGGTIRRQYNCTHVEAKSEALDYAVLRVQPVVGTGGVAGEPVYERLANTPDAKLEDAFIVHHSMCQIKKVSDKCKVLSLDHPNWLKGDSPREITHDCDTEHGASGAPVFNAQGQMVALHHLGFRRDPQTCERLDRVNKAVPLRHIIVDLKENTPGLANELGL